MSTGLSELELLRRNSLSQLRELGIDPYPAEAFEVNASAADILAIQDPDLSVRILAELDSTKMSKIFNLMDKEVSARLQKQFLQMKK